MYLEIESEAGNFTKFSLKFLGFYGAFGYFFLNFGVFSNLRQNRSTGQFQSTESFEPSIVNFPQNSFNLALSLKTHPIPHSRPFLSIFLQFFPPKLSQILSITLSILKAQKFLINFLQLKKTPNILQTLIASHLVVDHGTNGRIKEKRKGANKRGITSTLRSFRVSLS